MLIQYASDLHLEFVQNKEFLHLNPLKAEGEMLLLAGDIVPFAVMDKQNDFFNYVSDHFETIYWIPGNHEYYYSDLAEKSTSLNENIRPNIHMVNNLSVQTGPVRFIFSTLWSKISQANRCRIEQSMSDFQVIRFNNFPFTSEQYNFLHDESLSFIKKGLQRNYTDKIVVVTHHVPTFFNYPEKYRGDILNEAFAVELYDLVEEYGPEFWIFGHHHHNTPDFVIGKTSLKTNQLGYVKYGEHKHFHTSAIFEV